MLQQYQLQLCIVIVNWAKDIYLKDISLQKQMDLIYLFKTLWDAFRRYISHFPVDLE